MTLRMNVLTAIVAATAMSALAGCGSMKESIANAQASADRAQAAADSAQAAANNAASQAQAASGSAQRAQMAADQASQKADATQARVDQFIADQQAAEQRRRGRNMAMAGERG